MYRISGRRVSHVRHLDWIERCIHFLLLLSFTILSVQQAFTSPTYVFKATKFGNTHKKPKKTHTATRIAALTGKIPGRINSLRSVRFGRWV